MTAASPSQPHYRTSADRPSSLGQIVEGWREVWSRRRLIRYLVQADMKKTGADTLLGNIWWVMDPLLQMVVYVVFISIIRGTSTPDYPLFVFAAILPWKWFMSSTQEAITSVVARERLIKQLQFPKLVLPVSSTASGLVSFMFGLIPLAGLLLLVYRDRLDIYLLLLPAVMLVQFVFTLAIGILLSAVNTFYRDVGNVSRHALRLWFYLSPALYSIEEVYAVHPMLAELQKFNPFAVLFTSYRNIIYEGTMPDWQGLAIWLVVSLVLVALSTAIFKRVEPSFAKIL